jgi:protocatechuate 3,4-dioxygenase beta subunit
MPDKLTHGMMVFAIIATVIGVNAVGAIEFKCTPTPADSEGPFYKPDAPVRSSVGKGYSLSGVVKSAKDCTNIPGAKIEFWLAAPNGTYDDEHRATLLADPSGRYVFECNFPPAYASRPPHIHIRVTADGFKTLVTQHYPEKGSPRGDLALVMVPK